jgi:hypothetical protein
MDTRRVATAALPALVLLAAATCNETTEPGTCDAEALAASLAGAVAGDTVRVGACRLAGSFTVPAGVALVGEGAGQTTLVSAGRRPVLIVEAGSPATRVADLAVESSSNAGVLVRGSGAATVERLAVRAERGMAVAADGVATLTLRELELSGTIDEGNATTVLATAMPDGTVRVDPAVWPTHGLVLSEVGTATLEQVRATGFAAVGALLVESTTTWTGGGAPGNLGTGVLVHGGSADLARVDVSRSLQGVLVLPAYGAVFAEGATVETRDMLASQSEGYALLHSNATGRHIDLTARDNGDAAVWVQGSASRLELTGAGTVISGNRFAGVVIHDAAEATVSDARIDGSRLATRIFGTTGSVLVGDGIQVASADGPVTVRNVALSGNERVGLLVELAGATGEALTIDGVTVDGTGTQNGAVAQGGTPDPGWDSGVTRTGATEANDAAPLSRFSIAGRVAADRMPTDGAAVEGTGLIGIIDPTPPG